MLQESQRSILRTLCIRFASDDVKTSILESRGYLIEFSHQQLLLFKEMPQKSHADQIVANANVGNSDDPMVLTLTRRQGVITLAQGKDELLKWRDPTPLHCAGEKENSASASNTSPQLVLGLVSIVDSGQDRQGGRQGRQSRKPPSLPGREIPGPGRRDRDKTTTLEFTADGTVVYNFGQRDNMKYEASYTIVSDTLVEITWSEETLKKSNLPLEQNSEEGKRYAIITADKLTFDPTLHNTSKVWKRES